jgi:RNA polymerase sigma factor (sigma-70 family)
MQRLGSRKAVDRATQPAASGVEEQASFAGQDLVRLSEAPARELPIRPALLGDERLARLVGRGSERAFATIYERYHQRLYRYCYSLLRDRDDAYDAVQSTLVSAFAALEREQRDAPLRPWLFRIAHNEAISVIRRREGAWEPNDTLEPCAPSAEDRAQDRARLALLVTDLGQLPERERSVLLMRELSGLSYQDIAVALGISIYTVKHAIVAARRSLREFEEGRAMVCKDVQRSLSQSDASVLPGARAHLRDCTACTAFGAEIPARRADLHALASPLPPVLAAALLARLHGAASTAAAGGGGLAAGVAGKAAGAAFAAKALVGFAVVAIASASVTSAVSSAKHDPHRPGAGPIVGATGAHNAARHDEQPLGVDSSQERHYAASADVPGTPPSGAITDARVPSTRLVPVPPGSGTSSSGASVRELRPARRIGIPVRTRTGSRSDGRRFGVAAPGLGTRSLAGAKHHGETSGVPGNDASPGGRSGQSSAQGDRANPAARSVAEGHLGGPPAPATRMSPPIAADAVSSQPNTIPGGSSPIPLPKPSLIAPNPAISAGGPNGESPSKS